MEEGGGMDGVGSIELGFTELRPVFGLQSINEKHNQLLLCFCLVFIMNPFNNLNKECVNTLKTVGEKV